MLSKRPLTKSFSWQGIDAHGFRVQGRLSATSTLEAKAILANSKITLVKIQQKSLSQWFLTQNKIKNADINEFSVEFSTLVGAGIPLAGALAILAESTHKLTMKNLLVAIKTQLESGQPLSAALQVNGKYFDSFFCNLVYAAEQSGTLDLILNQLAVHREKTASIKNNLKKALFYPVIVVIVTLVVSYAMLVLILPQFEQLFHTVGADLPELTRVVIYCANLLRLYGPMLLVALLLIGILLKIGLQRFASWQARYDRYWLKWPLLGKIGLAAIFARCFGALSTTLSAGLPLLEALQLTANVAGNSLYKQGFIDIGQQVRTGQTLSLAVQNTHLFPSRVIQMIRVGEESGRLDIMLQKLTDYFSQRVDYQLQNLSRLLEPALMILLSVLVGTLVIAMYLPMFRLGAIL